MMRVPQKKRQSVRQYLLPEWYADDLIVGRWDTANSSLYNLKNQMVVLLLHVD